MSSQAKGGMDGAKRARLGFFLACLVAGLGCARADETPRVQPLPDLVRVGPWNPAGASGATLDLEQWPDALAVFDTPDPGRSDRVLLREPLPVPAWATGFTFLLGNDGAGGIFELSLVVEDAAGQQLLYRVVPTPPNSAPQFNTGKSPYVNRPFRVLLHNLQQPVLAPQEGFTAEMIGRKQPASGPYRILGVQIDGFSKTKGLRTGIFFQDFAFTHLTPRTASSYYSIDNQGYLGELDPTPGIPIARLGNWTTGHLVVDWAARDRYDGQPFQVGRQEFDLAKDDPARPHAWQLAQPVQFPIPWRGTYWIRAKTFWTKEGSDAPAATDEQEFRLMVVRGPDPTPHALYPADRTLGDSLIRVAPDRLALTWRTDEPLVIPFSFWFPPKASGAATFHVEVRPFDDNGVIASKDGSIQPGPAPTQAQIDLTSLLAGPYRIRAQVLVGGKVIDQSDRVVGKLSPVETAHGEIPASVPSWQEIINGKQALLYLDPFTMENQRTDPGLRWSLMKAFLDHAGTVSREIEMPIVWKNAEPLPGVYNWAEFDRIVDYAQSKGLTVLLWPEIVSLEPEWVPSYFTQNAEGSIIGTNRYFFHGGRVNYWHAPVVRDLALDFLGALAAHYRGNPAVQGYQFITEHPDEAPSVGWWEGYDPETLAHFQKTVRQKWPTLGAVNQRWGTSFTAWDQIGAPPEPSSPRYLLDWLTFRRDAIGDFLLDSAKTIRKADPKRLIMIYIDGVELHQVPEFLALGCMFNNGGSHDPEIGGLGYLGRGALGMNERTEERTVAHWSDVFPTQLDASLFSMALGGGGHANAKMYILLGKSFDELRHPTYSLDRFEKFMPIWRELRPTVAMPFDAYFLDDEAGRLMKTRSTFWPGEDSATNRLCFQSHLLAPAVPLDTAVKGKLLLLLGPYVRTLESATIEGIAHDVENGGTVVMQADAGRLNVDQGSQDWALLQRLGFAPPTAPQEVNRHVVAVPVTGDCFSAEAKPFLLADTWVAAPQTGAQDLAMAQDDPNRALVTTKPLGRGRVVVIWASSVVPPTDAGETNEPFLKDLARWAGVRLDSDADSFSLWTNLLENPATKTFYGLVYHALWREPQTVGQGHVFWTLPAGRYSVTEMVSGQSIGTFSAQALQSPGLDVNLPPHALAIYRMELAGVK